MHEDSTLGDRLAGGLGQPLSDSLEDGVNSSTRGPEDGRRASKGGSGDVVLLVKLDVGSDGVLEVRVVLDLE